MKSILDTSYNRLDEAHRAWHGALDGYHRIEDFRANVNTAIQALRNVTFALQKQKDNLIGFDEWYSVWQGKMRNDPILKELHEARNIIVKEEDLKLHSEATARTKGWVEFEKMAFTFDPAKNSHEVAKGFYHTYAKHLPVEEAYKHRLIFEFERKWVYEKIPNTELLEAIAHSYNFLYSILLDAENHFSLTNKNDLATGGYCSADLNEKNELQCMIITPQERRLTLSFQDGKDIKMHTETIHRNEDELERVHKKYGDEWKSEKTITILEDFFPKDYPYDQMKLFAQLAIANLKKDKSLIPTTFIFKENKEPPIITALYFQNQEQKVMAIESVADKILKNEGHFVFFLAEVWQYHYDKEKPIIPSHKNNKGAKDLLQFVCLSTEKVKVITLPFHKNIFGQIIFEKGKTEDFPIDDHTQFILIPLIKALKAVKTR